MRPIVAMELFRQITQEYFAHGTVKFADQSRVQKSSLPLVVLKPGAVRRPLHPNVELVDGELVQCYPSRLSFTVDLFTHGAPVKASAEDEAATGIPEGTVVAYANTAMSDLTEFMDYLNSQHVIDWCAANDCSVLTDGDPQDTSGVVNDTNYEYRARLTVMFYFTQQVTGYAGASHENSILYPDGAGGWTSTPPVETESPTNGYVTEAMEKEAAAKVEPVYEPTPSGGGSEELVSEETGYFTEVEIKEEKLL